MNNLAPLILSALTLGLSAGLSPGPLTTLTISQTLRHGSREGVKIALAPLLTDLPIILAALFILARLENQGLVLGGIALAGAGFLAYLGWESLRFQGLAHAKFEAKPQSWQKGMAANFLNPNPYLFWFTIGGPLLIQAQDSGPTHTVLFLLMFYLLLVGTKMLLAWLVGRWRDLLGSRGYVLAIRILGLCLWAFAGYFLWQGLGHLGLV